MYDGPIIDAHTHLWDLSLGKHPWLIGPDSTDQPLGNLDSLRRNYLPDDYVRDSARQNITASVHIEASWDPADPLGETAWLESIEKPHGVATRYIASAPIGSPAAAAVLERQAAFARVVGVREILSFHPKDAKRSFAKDGSKATDPQWRRDIAILPALGLTLELMMYPYQLEQVLDVARTTPELQIVINHCASPIDRDEDGMARWRAAVRQLSRESNIALKVSNIAAYDPAPTYDSLRAVALHCIDCFGPDRTLFATDWPAAALFSTFDGVYDTFRRIAAEMTQDEQAALFYHNAKRFYRIP